MWNLLYVQESVGLNSVSSTVPVPVPGPGLESQGRAASMPRLNVELQVTALPHVLNCSECVYKCSIGIMI